MPPRTYRDLTPEQLAELQSEFTPHAAVPRLPVGALASRADTSVPWQVRMPEAGDLRFLDELAANEPASPGGRMMLAPTTIHGQMPGDSDANAWLDELIRNPPSTPKRSMVSAVGPKGETFSGEDTPESRDLIKQRGMRTTEQSPPSDHDLLNALASQRPASMPDLGGDRSVDDLIGAESAAMDRERQAQQETEAAARAPRRSREAEVLDELHPPTRTQGWLAALGDALYGGHMVDNVNARANDYQQARAQARAQDVQAAERADEKAADREMLDRRLGLTERGQDLANQRGEENQHLRWLLAQQSDQRARELQSQRDTAGEQRARILAHTAPTGPEAQAGDLDAQAAYLADAASRGSSQNVTQEQAKAFLKGELPEGALPPEAIERMSRDKALLQRTKNDEKKYLGLLAGGAGREAGNIDKPAVANETKRWDPKARTALKNELTRREMSISAAVRAWKQLSPSARAALAKIGPNGDLAEAGLSGEDQARAARIQALANFDIKQAAGSAVTGSEWKRIAGEIGLPDGISAFKSPQVIEGWLRQHTQLFKQLQNNALSEYPSLFEEGQ